MPSSLTTGPEGSACAVVFDGTFYLSQENKKNLPSDFTVLFWSKGVSFAGGNVQPVLSIKGSTPSNDFDISFNTATKIDVGGTQVTIQNLTSAWSLNSIIRTSGTIKVYQNYSEKGSFADFSSFGGSEILVGTNDKLDCIEGYISGVKVVPRAFTLDDISFHYNDTLNNSGNNTWPKI
jgi:hypothetical protein